MKKIVGLLLFVLLVFKSNAQLQCFNKATGRWEDCGGSSGGSSSGSSSGSGGGGINFDKFINNIGRMSSSAAAAKAANEREIIAEAKKVEEARISAEEDKLNIEKANEYQKRLNSLNELTNRKKDIEDYIAQLKRDEDEFKAKREDYLKSLKGTPSEKAPGPNVNSAGNELKSIHATDSKLSNFKTGQEGLLKGESGKGFDTPGDYAGSLPSVTLSSGKTIPLSAKEYQKTLQTLAEKDPAFKAKVAQRDARQKEYDNYAKQKEELDSKVKTLFPEMLKQNPPKEITEQFNKAVQDQGKISGLKSKAEFDLNPIKKEVDEQVIKTFRFQKESMDESNPTNNQTQPEH